jgi:glycosyltransferase involved in cell wall biosynthesis
MYELAKTGHDFHLLLVDRPPWGKDWDVKSRPIPLNVKVIGEAELFPSLDMNQYDLLLAESYDDFELIDGVPKPKILLAHSVAALPSPDGLSRAEALRRLYLEQRLTDLPVIYVSHYVAHNWGLPGRVILHSVDVGDYHLHKGEKEAALTVAHFFKERDVELGYSLHQKVVRDDIPYKIVGHNPTLPDSGPAGSWDELKSFYQDHRVYLNTTLSGNSLAMLEAMAAGMPVITTPRPTRAAQDRPVIDGYNGFVSNDSEYLREKVKFLLDNPEVARKMGERAREAVRERHRPERFIREWQEVFEGALSGQAPRACPVGNLPPALYEKANLVSDPSASLGRALFWPAWPPKEHLLYGPFIYLPSGHHEITFYVRLDERSPLRTWASSFVHARFSRFHAKWGEGDPMLALLDICSEPEARVHVHRILHRSHFRPWGSYQGFKLVFQSRGEKFFQFRVLPMRLIALYVDPYRTWASIQMLGDGR